MVREEAFHIVDITQYPFYLQVAEDGVDLGFFFDKSIFAVIFRSLPKSSEKEKDISDVHSLVVKMSRSCAFLSESGFPFVLARSDALDKIGIEVAMFFLKIRMQILDYLQITIIIVR